LVRIGIDVGGTSTDAVAMDGDVVVAWTKRPTTDDVGSGLEAALAALLEQEDVTPGAIDAVMIGTTHFINALLQARDLDRVGVLRLALPATATVPPLVDWPEPLRQSIDPLAVLVHGGHEFDGREIAPLDDDEVASALAEMVAGGCTSLAIAGVFSPATPAHELEVGATAARLAPDLLATLSHQVGRLGLIERENACVLNAALATLARRVVGSYTASLAKLGIDADLYVSQNDGTVASVDDAVETPLLTFASGPTNSMRGAAKLAGVTDALVLDVGGTTTDGGAIVGGFPRPAPGVVQVAGVRTTLRMPDVTSIGLGGGSMVADDGAAIGPQSVGARLTTEALVFGGRTLTLTDVAVAAGRAEVGDRALVADVPRRVIDAACRRADEMADALVDTIRPSAAPLQVVVVGGGGALIGLGAGDPTSRPEHASVANAVGAALAQVGAEIDRVVSLRSMEREHAIAAARDDAIAAVVARGGDAGRAEIVEIDEIPFAYVPDALRIRVRAVAELS
jgi:N-methylhydantoinase A/oxoprolinase/acetone carboxylase beta subunit